MARKELALFASAYGNEELGQVGEELVLGTSVCLKTHRLPKVRYSENFLGFMLKGFGG